MMTNHTQPGSDSARTWVLALTSVAALMVALDALVVTTALSTIRLHLHASIGQLEWTVNAYGLSFAVLLMTGSALGDRLGRRRLFTTGLGLFTAASAACALAPDIGSLIAARTVQGAGAAMVMPLALAQLSTAFPPERRAWALGIFSSITGLAVLGGPVVGGAITQGIAWQWIFWLNVPIGLLAIPLILRRIDESFGPGTRLDIGGVILEAGAALGIVWSLVRGNSAGWGSVEVIASIALGVLFAAAFVAWELRVREPMLPMRLFRSREFSAGNAAIFFLTASLVGAVFFMAQFLQTAQSDGPLDAGLRLLPLTTTLFFIAPLAGALINRVGERPLILGGLLLEAVGMAWIALIAAPHVAYVEMVAPLIVAGAGVSMAIPATQSAAIKSVSVEHIGKASGTFSTMRQLGGAFGVAILVAVFSGTGSYASAQAFTNGFAPALGIAAALSLTGTIAVLALTTRRSNATQRARRQPRASLSTPKRPAAAPVPIHNQ
jgi:EmrB/QacA subfamily drug resistance transporter